MLSDKEVKKEFRKKAWKNPEQYYAVSVLKENGFKRSICKKCGKPFWSVTNSQFCGDPACSGGFRFIDSTPVKKPMDYIKTWETFSSLFKKLGYTPIKRYPVVARWRDDTDFVQASIYDFQPFVVSGEVKPPANPLVVPQFCLRFNDIDNVGITGAHYTGFVMIGQHAFMQKQDWDQAKYFNDIYTWLKKGLGLPDEEITFHEDAWAGGGNFGPCMEYFSRGLELGNQVYMLYEQTPQGPKELKIKVLDMGMGHERNTWFSQGKATSYDAVFPTVMKKLYKETGIEPDNTVIKKFLPYSSYLNIDEVENVDKVWKEIADKLKIKTEELKKKILPLSALYSVAEHSRALLVALSDGALPSNIGGYYNLRVILRRALSFIDKYKWDISLNEICKEHAKYLKPLFPELSENLNEVNEILDVEKIKYENTKQKSSQIVSQIIKRPIKEEDLVNLYDSYGISPEVIKEEAIKLGKNINIPDNFYVKVAERHKKEIAKEIKKDELPKETIEKLQATKALYYDDYSKVNFKAKIVKIIDNKIILDKTYFYPTSGGQEYDTGYIQNDRVVNVFKQGNIIVHVLQEKHLFPEGEEVECRIDWDRRLQLAQHHTATHILNAAARRILGKHINQAGAKKDVDKAHIDITHFRSLTPEEIEKIEKEANKILSEKIPLTTRFFSRDEAEKSFGTNIYQGGIVPGKDIRIVEIPEVDVEACGGTHLKNTFEAGFIKILKATKISDSIVRLEFKAGKAAADEVSKESFILEKIAKLLDVNKNEVPGRAEELFELWKDVVKKDKNIKVELKSTKEENLKDKELLEKTAEILKTQPEHLEKTISRFLKELKEKDK